jgi:chromosome segregation ATPase
MEGDVMIDSPFSNAIREDIASVKDNIRSLEERADAIREQLPELETELLVCERDAAIAKLELVGLRAKLAAALDGAA